MKSLPPQFHRTLRLDSPFSYWPGPTGFFFALLIRLNAHADYLSKTGEGDVKTLFFWDAGPNERGRASADGVGGAATKGHPFFTEV